MTTALGTPLKADLFTTALEPMPLDKSAVLEGHPEPRGTELWHSADKRRRHGVWCSRPGTFRSPTFDECFSSWQATVWCAPTAGTRSPSRPAT
jgi:hypothetical protein